MACLAHKPVVDRLEADLGDRATVLRVSIQTEAGRQLGQKYRLYGTPLFVVLNSAGHETWRGRSAPDMDTVLGISSAGP